jgi:SAM-dependent methyltransferase
LVESIEQANCLVCNENRPVFLYSGFDRLLGLEGEFKLVTCSNCGFVYLNPILQEKDIGKYYPVSYYSFQKWTDKVGFFRAFYRKLKWRSLSLYNLSRAPGVPKFKKNGRLLDFGCGSGEVLSILKRIGWETHGVELNEEAVKYARSKGLDIFDKDIRSIHFPDDHFDVIRMRSVLEHLYDAPQIMGEIHRILKKDGNLLLICPNIQSFSSRLFKGRWYHLDLPRHLYHFSSISLVSFLKKQHFQFLSTRTCGSGGILGSLDYLLNEKKKRRGTRLLNNKILRVMFYFAFEFWVNRLRAGDLIEVQARKM